MILYVIYRETIKLMKSKKNAHINLFRSLSIFSKKNSNCSEYGDVRRYGLLQYEIPQFIIFKLSYYLTLFKTF